MRKAIMAILIIFAVLFCGCTQSKSTSNTQEEVTDERNTEKVTEELDTEEMPDYHFYELSDNPEEILDYYRFEVARRIRSERDFVKEEEASWYKSEGYEVHNLEEGVLYRYFPNLSDGDYYYYPLPVSVEGTNHLVYTTRHGSVLIAPIISTGNVIGDLHLTYKEIEVLGSPTVLDNFNYEIIVYSEKGFQVYQFGKLIATLDVTGEYCGHCTLNGYLFRDGTDVCAVRFDDDLEVYYSVPIAHHVKYVIEPNYKLSSDAWSQPLFLMEDGSLKAYLGWNNKDVLDSPDNLVDPYYEGGYH